MRKQLKERSVYLINAKCCKPHLPVFLLLGATGGGCLGFWSSRGQFFWFSHPREDAGIKQSTVRFLPNLFLAITIILFGDSFTVYHNFPLQKVNQYHYYHKRNVYVVSLLTEWPTLLDIRSLDNLKKTLKMFIIRGLFPTTNSK